MNLELRIKEVDSLRKKGIQRVIEVKTSDFTLSNLRDVKEYVHKLSEEVSKKLGRKIDRIEFIGNEDIGTRYILYRFRLYTGDRYIACRIVTYFNRHIQTILTVGD